VWKKRYSRRSVRKRQKKDFMPRMQDWEKAAVVGLESSSIPYTRRSIAKQHVNKSSERHSKRGGYRKRCEKDV